MSINHSFDKSNWTRDYHDYLKCLIPIIPNVKEVLHKIFIKCIKVDNSWSHDFDVYYETNIELIIGGLKIAIRRAGNYMYMNDYPTLNGRDLHIRWEKNEERTKYNETVIRYLENEGFQIKESDVPIIYYLYHPLETEALDDCVKKRFEEITETIKNDFNL